MIETTLLWAGLFQLATGIVYALVGYRVSRRRLTGDDKVAMNLFVTWWYGLSVVSIVGSMYSLLAAFDRLSVTIYEALLSALLLVLCVALWGLAYYLIYLFTGSPRYMWPLAAFYGVFFLWLLYLVAAADLVGVTVGRWQIKAEYANEDVFGGSSARYLSLLLLGPLVLGAIGYGLLYFRAESVEARYRIGLVSLSLVAWFGSSILAAMTGVNQREGWNLVSQSISLTASLLILMAFQPPRWIQIRLRRGSGDEGSAT